MYICMRLLYLSKINTNVLKPLQYSIGGQAIRCASKIFYDSHRSQSTEVTHWMPIYRFPFIAHAKILNRFKLYQTLLTATFIPITSLLCYYNLLEFSVVKVFITGGSLACVTLFLMTWYFRRLIGMIYISADEKLVKVAHLTFWGNRNDVLIPMENIIPLTDCEYNIGDFYVKLQRYDVKDVLYFSLKYGQILNKDKFKLVFGDLDLLKRFKK